MTADEVHFGQVDLTTCDREPIHIPGSIQPHGVMLVADRETLAILQYAGNTGLLLGVEPGLVLESSLTDLFENPKLASLIDHLRAPAPSVKPIVLLDMKTRHGEVMLTATFHIQGSRAIIELEPRSISRTASGDPLSQLTAMLSALQSATDIEDCCRIATAQVRGLIGFSRVMVYQFLHDGSGKVLVENKQDRLDSFLHLHYPASDIPKQAQALYRRSWIRLIPDTSYTPIPLQPSFINPEDMPLDMSHCALRSVSPLHLGYLRNMGVGASMSMSIMIGNKLWGLIVCHNDMPRHVASDLRLACELFAQLFSLQLDAVIERTTAQRRSKHQHVQALLAKSLPHARDIASELVSGKVTLLDLIPAGGVAVWLSGQLHTLGQTPPADAIAEVVAWLNTLAHPVISTFQLGIDFAPAISYCDTACGLLAISLSRHPEDYVIWFRPEMVRTVTWAGDPHKPVKAGGAHMMPRESFAACKADVLQQSTPWDVVDIEAAHAFRLWLLETVLRQMADLARQEREAAFQRQSMLMAELDHRVKNTLANIQALIRQTKASASSLEDFALGLEMRLRAMARAHDLIGANNSHGASVRKLIEEELAPFRSEKNDHSVIHGCNFLLSSKAAMPFTMVMHELTSNAAKYGALSNLIGSVVVEWFQNADDGALVLVWKERNGPLVQPPARRGFGSVVIERSLLHEIKGSAVLRFDPDGVSCVITIPVEHIVNEVPLDYRTAESDAVQAYRCR